MPRRLALLVAAGPLLLAAASAPVTCRGGAGRQRSGSAPARKPGPPKPTCGGWSRRRPRPATRRPSWPPSARPPPPPSPPPKRGSAPPTPSSAWPNALVAQRAERLARRQAPLAASARRDRQHGPPAAFARHRRLQLARRIRPRPRLARHHPAGDPRAQRGACRPNLPKAGDCRPPPLRRAAGWRRRASELETRQQRFADARGQGGRARGRARRRRGRSRRRRRRQQRERSAGSSARARTRRAAIRLAAELGGLPPAPARPGATKAGTCRRSPTCCPSPRRCPRASARSATPASARAG